VSFAIANNLIAPGTKATNLKIHPRATTTTWNNYKNLKDGSLSMKHLKRCSYTIPESAPKNKWGIVAKTWANKVLSMTNMCSS
jgi:hypothetical protein